MSFSHSNRKNRGSAIVGVLITLIVLLLVADTAVIALCFKTPSGTAAPTEAPTLAATEETELPTIATETTEPPTTMPEPEHVVSTATIVSTGDILMHMPVISSGAVGTGYNFGSIFRYVTDDISAADYAVANLETTLAGTDNGYQYAGFPNFNSPDAIVDAVKNAGFDMLLTANNHSYDTTLVGYKRTLEVVRGAGLETLGTYLDADEQKWTIADINDIKVGMLCYTYATGVGSNGAPQLNGNAAIKEAGICNFFSYNNLPAFYSEVEGYLNDMKEAGAEATVLYIHWGDEYQLKPNQTQTAMAQQLCDLGIDVIIGGHPHVVQPMDLLESTTDPDHKTVILYSMGNAVSNQRAGNISSISTAHTEDGVLFSITFSKYSDGTVYLEDVDLVPTWVYMNSNSGSRQYNIVPLHNDLRDQWQTDFNMSDNDFNNAQRSYDRTDAIVSEGLTKSKEYLAQQKQQREDDYLAQAQNAA